MLSFAGSTDVFDTARRSPVVAARLSVLALFHSIVANAFRMLLGPMIRSQRFKFGAASEQLIQDVLHISPGIEIIANGAAYQ